MLLIHVFDFKTLKSIDETFKSTKYFRQHNCSKINPENGDTQLSSICINANPMKSNQLLTFTPKWFKFHFIMEKVCEFPIYMIWSDHCAKTQYIFDVVKMDGGIFFSEATKITIGWNILPWKSHSIKWSQKMRVHQTICPLSTNQFCTGAQNVCTFQIHCSLFINKKKLVWSHVML